MADLMRQTNPFPGIRSFESSEDHLFFGRERQVEAVTAHLFRTQFISIIGSSGCGKSSLVKAGLIPVLFKHKYRNLKNDWNLSLFRPGDDPIENMAQSLYEFYGENNLHESHHLSKEEIKKMLFDDTEGLVNVIREQDKQLKRNRLILIDQFEEIFRYRHNTTHENSNKEALHFVNLFLNSFNKKEDGIFVILTMRSDFLGDCTEFPGLTEAINTGHYLVPRMTEDEKKKAIVGPIIAMDSDISDELTTRLLSDVGDNPDQLPVMQHALMRTWDYWMINKTQNQDIGIEHYEAIGGMQSALSLHAEEIYTELPDKESRKITEKIFKALTDLGTDNKGTRRPTQLQELLTLTNASEDKIVNIIDAFRASGRAFLMPPPQEKLDLDTMIDISHESIMRVWTRLKEWVDEETKSAALYKRLSKSAELYHEGNTGLWINPDLQVALHWQTENKPNATWAMRYDPYFDRAINFLEYSKKEYNLVIAHKEHKQKRDLKRAKIFAIILGSASIISLLFLIVSLNLRFKAEASEKRALEKEKTAIVESKKATHQRKQAIIQKKIAEQQQQIAEQQKIITEEQKQYAVEQQLIAVDAKDEAVVQKAKAEEAKVIAIHAKDEAETQKNKAVEQQIIADNERAKAEISEKNAKRLRMLALAKSVAIKASELNNNTKGELPELLALQAFHLNKMNDGPKKDPDIFNALLHSSNSTKIIHSHSGDVRSITTSPDGKLIASISDNDNIKIRDIVGDSEIEIELKKWKLDHIRCVSFSPQGNYLAAGSLNGNIYIWDIKNTEEKPTILIGHSALINKIDYNSSGNKLLSASNDGKLLLWDLSQKTSSFLVIDSSQTRINTVQFNKTDGRIAWGKKDGTIYIFDLDKPSSLILEFEMGSSQIISLAIKKNKLIAGNADGKILLWDMSDVPTKPIEFIGHTSGVTAIRYLPNESEFVSSSYDGTIRLWNYKSPENQPIVLKGHDSWIYDISLIPNNNKLVSSSADKSMRIWTINPTDLSDIICRKVTRTLTNDEWGVYFGDDITQEDPCKNNSIGNHENKISR